MLCLTKAVLLRAEVLLLYKQRQQQRWRRSFPEVHLYLPEYLLHTYYMLGPILGTGDRGVSQVRSPLSWIWVPLWWSTGAHNKQTKSENLKIELLHPAPPSDPCSQGTFSVGLPDHPWRSEAPSPHTNISEYLYIH